MGALASRLSNRRKILSNATTERLSPKSHKEAEKRVEKARKKGKPHLEITSDGYISLVVRVVLLCAFPYPSTSQLLKQKLKKGTPPKSSQPAPPATTKGKDRKKTNDDSSAATTASSRPPTQQQKESAPAPDPIEEDSFYDEAFGLIVCCVDLWLLLFPMPVSLTLFFFSLACRGSIKGCAKRANGCCCSKGVEPIRNTLFRPNPEQTTGGHQQHCGGVWDQPGESHSHVVVF